MTSSDARELRIAVAGAGIGGLACARGLAFHGLPVTVFERDAARDSRPQGSMLDLHVPTGQAAMRALGLYAQFRALARPEAQELRGLDPFTTDLVHHEQPPGEDSDGYAPEIDRRHLRDLMLDSLPPATVHWGHGIDAVDTITPRNGGARVHFADGTTEDFDLVIGADGAWSRVRPAVSDAVPAYTGQTIIEGFLDDADTRFPALAARVGSGTLVANADGRMLSVMRNSGGNLRVYAAFPAPTGWAVTSGVDLSDTAAVCDYLKSIFAGWDDGLFDFFRACEGGVIDRPLHILPVGHRWDPVPGVTLLGDAAHLMPPFGIGANLALLDGADLAAAIAAHGITEGVSAYERIMQPRAAAAAEACAELMANLEDGGIGDVDSVRRDLNERMRLAQPAH